MDDVMTGKILKLLNASNEPLETKDIEEKIRVKISGESVTRTKIFYRLNLLRGEAKIKGKFVGPGKGVWIWWREGSFPDTRA